MVNGELSIVNGFILNSLLTIHKKLISEQSVQVSDTTGADESSVVDKKKIQTSNCSIC
jgi:hypothetical protein